MQHRRVFALIKTFRGRQAGIPALNHVEYAEPSARIVVLALTASFYRFLGLE